MNPFIFRSHTGSGAASAGSNPEQRTQRRFAAVALVLAGGVTLAFGAVLVRVAQLQLAPSHALRDHFEPRVTRRTEMAPRPDIVDRRDRPLSVTRFGSRVIVDPTLLPADIDVAITRLADAVGIPAEDLGQRIMKAIVENQARLAEAEESAGQGATTTGATTMALHGRAEPPQRAALPPSTKKTLDPAKPIASRFLALVKDKLRPIAGLEAGTDDLDAPPAAEPEQPTVKPPIRYLAASGLLSDEQARTVRALKMPGVSLEKRQVREYPGGPAVAAIVGKVGYENKGLIGAERMLNADLTGENGHIDFVRDAHGRPMWIEQGQIKQAQPGDDVRLSIDLEVQRIAVEELTRGIEESDGAGGRCLVVDPISGEILAMVDIMREVPEAEPFPWADDPQPDPDAAPLKKGQKRAPKSPAPQFPSGHHRWVVNKPDPSRNIHPALARNRCVEDVYEPGSTFKPYVWSTITELGLAKVDEVFETGRDGWRTPDGRWIKDVHTADSFTWSNVLVQSSNIGMIKGAQRLTYQQLHDAVCRFGFGKATNLGLPGESPGLVTSMKNWKLGTQVSVAFGNEIAVTPVQMARAFCAFSRPGELAGTLPRLRLTVDRDDSPGVTYRVLPASTAALTRDTMKGVTGAMEVKYCPPPPGEHWRYMIFGKSGTAKIPIGAPPKGKRSYRGVPYHGYLDQYRSSFIAGGPLEDPRLVVLVIMDDPGPERIAKRTYYGAATAGPVVRRVMERTLTYLGTPPSPPETQVAEAAH